MDKIVEITYIPPKDIDNIWTKLKPFVALAAEFTYGRFTTNDIRTGYKKGNQQLWLAHEGEEVLGFSITEIIEYPQTRALVMHFTGGKDLPLWKTPMLKDIQEFGSNNGCDIIESYGRVGWGKVFKEDGYKARFTFYELPVEK